MADTYHLQLLRGNTSRVQAYTGREGELVYNMQLKNLWIHDGTTRGGIAIANVSDIPTKLSEFENDANFVTSAPGSDAADAAIHDQLGNTIHLYYAPINSPTFTGTPTCPTPAAGDKSKKIVNSEWVAQATCVVHTTGNETINGTKTFTNVINGTALRAQWADLAELYKADDEYEPGTLVAFGGDQEITVAKDVVNAVVSDQPAYLMNSNMQGGTPIALAGRVNVRIKHPVKKFDKLVLSDVPGVATVNNRARKPIGRALEDSDGPLVLAVVKFEI